MKILPVINTRIMYVIISELLSQYSDTILLTMITPLKWITGYYISHRFSVSRNVKTSKMLQQQLSFVFDSFAISDVGANSWPHGVSSASRSSLPSACSTCSYPCHIQAFSIFWETTEEFHCIPQFLRLTRCSERTGMQTHKHGLFIRFPTLNHAT
jgi:hypothetical protein